MATDNETRTLLSKCLHSDYRSPEDRSAYQRGFLDKQLLSAAQQGDVEELLTSAEYRDPKNELEFLFDINCKNA